MNSKQEKTVIDGLMSIDKNLRNNAIKLIYKECYRKTELYIISNGGDKIEAKDIFQEAVIILYENVNRQKFLGQSSIFTYLYGICKNLWLTQIKKASFQVLHHATVYNTTYDDQVKNEQINIPALHDMLLYLNHDCRKILWGFYYEMKSMKELMRDFELGSEQATKNKKSRCLKKLSRFIDKHGLTYESFLN